MTQIPPEQQCILDDCDRAARDTSHGGGLCETHHAQMVDGIEDPTAPADDPTTEESTNDNTGDYTPGEASAYTPDEVDLEDVEPDTYPEDLVAAGARWLLWQDSDGRKVPRNPQ